MCSLAEFLQHMLLLMQPIHRLAATATVDVVLLCTNHTRSALLHEAISGLTAAEAVALQVFNVQRQKPADVLSADPSPIVADRMLIVSVGDRQDDIMHVTTPLTDHQQFLDRYVPDYHAHMHLCLVPEVEGRARTENVDASGPLTASYRLGVQNLVPPWLGTMLVATYCDGRHSVSYFLL